MFVWELKQIIHNSSNTILAIIIDEISTFFKKWCHRIYVSPFKTVNTHLPHDISLLFHAELIGNKSKEEYVLPVDIIHETILFLRKELRPLIKAQQGNKTLSFIYHFT
ncbi:hypothetical protein [Peribacillus phoenicis]|uniref:hypothetical protein n=1 Tax=Peribacillus sp. 1P06PA-2 TaxID=3132295 RepID=UPI0039A52A68